MEPKKLYRIIEQKQIAGVSAGLAEYFNIDVQLVRVLFVLSILFGTLGIWVYLILAVILPKK